MSDEQSMASESCLNKALYSGAIAAAVSGALSSGFYQAALHYSPFFKHQMGVQARTALVFMPVFYTTWLNVESTMWKCMESHKPKYEVVRDSIDEQYSNG